METPFVRPAEATGLVPRQPLLLLAGLFALALVAGPSLVGPADAAPPPRPVCAACGDALEDRANESGLSLTVTNSTAVVRVHDDGTATWVVRNEIREGAAVERLRANETLRRTLVDARYWDVAVQSVTVTDDGVLVPAGLVAAFLAVPLARPVRVFGLVFRLLLAVGDTLGLVVAGAPFFVFGATLGATEQATEAPPGDA